MSRYRIPQGWTSKQFSDALAQHEPNSRKIKAQVRATHLETEFDEEEFARKNKSITDKLDSVSSGIKQGFAAQEDLGKQSLTSLNVVKGRIPSDLGQTLDDIKTGIHTPTVLAPQSVNEISVLTQLALDQAAREGEKRAFEAIQRQGSAQASSSKPTLGLDLPDLVIPGKLPSMTTVDKDWVDARKKFYIAAKKFESPNSNW